MASTTVEYQRLNGTAAAIGRSGTHCVIADRPLGTAGGMGLGFNGGELLALALGGCLSNDIQYVAHDMNLTVDVLRLSVTVHFSGDPVLATGATMIVDCRLADGSDPSELIDRATARSTIANSLRGSMLIEINRA